VVAAGGNGTGKLQELFVQHKGIVEQLKKIRARRAELRKEILSFTEKLDIENAEHRALQDRLKALSEYRRQTAERLREGRVRLRELKEQLKGIEPSLLHRGEKMEEELKKLEWRLQTQRITREQEQEALSRMKELARSLSVWRKAFNLRDEVYRLEGDLDEDAARMLELRADRDEVIRALRERRRKIKDYIGARKQVAHEIKALDVDIADLERTLAELDERIDRAREELAAQKASQRSTEVKARSYLERKALESARMAALEKMKSGKALTFDELRVLYDEDLSTAGS